MITLKIDNSPDKRTDKEILDEINECSSSLGYLNHRTIQEDLCEIDRRLPKHGRWILHDVSCEEQYECSCCHWKFIEENNIGCDLWKYCPECGARMDQKLRFSSLGEDME